MSTYLGIDLGGTIVKLGLVRNGKILAKTTVGADSQAGLDHMMGPIGEASDRLLALTGTVDLSGVTLAFPGIVDGRINRAVSTNAKYNDAPKVDLESWVKEKYHVPFAMDNDARMALVGEWIHGAGRGAENMVMMTIGTGIGTGAVVDGRPLHGRNWCAGSLGGHFVIDYKGRRCSCGNVGCVEAQASSFFLPKIIGEDASLSVSFRRDETNFNFKILFEKFRFADPEAMHVVTECMNVWSAAIVTYIHAYDPEIIVVGGGIMKSADIILPYLRERVYSLAWCPLAKPEIVVSELGDDAALLAAEYYFKN